MPPSTGVSTGAASNPYPSNITVSGVTGTVSKITVSLFGLNHTFPDDIDMLLVGPGGQKVLILSDVGTTNDVVGVNLVLDDAAAASLPDSGQFVSGTFKPTNIGTGDLFPAPAPASPYGSLLSEFLPSSVNGTWSLYIVDDLGGDIGTLATGWALNITSSLPSVCSTTCAAAGPPTITPTAGGITVARGTTTNNVQIAVVSDPDTPLANLVGLGPDSSCWHHDRQHRRERHDRRRDGNDRRHVRRRPNWPGHLAGDGRTRHQSRGS